VSCTVWVTCWVNCYHQFCFARLIQPSRTFPKRTQHTQRLGARLYLIFPVRRKRLMAVTSASRGSEVRKVNRRRNGVNEVPQRNSLRNLSVPCGLEPALSIAKGLTLRPLLPLSLHVTAKLNFAIIHQNILKKYCATN
jgi:hypothetical protein